MKRKVFFIILLALVFAVSSTAAAKTEIKFYYPVGVAGPLVKVINGMVAAFEKENPDIDVEPVGAFVILQITLGNKAVVAQVDSHTQATLDREIELVVDMEKMHLFSTTAPHPALG